LFTIPAGGGYSPPVGGIPKSDLAQGVQESLGLADTALQPDALDDYYTVSETDDLLDGKADKAELDRYYPKSGGPVGGGPLIVSSATVTNAVHVGAAHISNDSGGSVRFTGPVDLQDGSVINIADPVSSKDAANKNYVDTSIQNMVAGKLGNAEQAVDSAKLGGELPGYYVSQIDLQNAQMPAMIPDYANIVNTNLLPAGTASYTFTKTGFAQIRTGGNTGNTQLSWYVNGKQVISHQFVDATLGSIVDIIPIKAGDVVTTSGTAIAQSLYYIPPVTAVTIGGAEIQSMSNMDIQNILNNL
jgi:hypothetical protein